MDMVKRMPQVILAAFFALALLGPTVVGLVAQDDADVPVVEVYKSPT